MVRLEILLPTDSVLVYAYLHSSMVRLEIASFWLKQKMLKRFTFQYGQIRNTETYLTGTNLEGFTFQYGQIRNLKQKMLKRGNK